VSGLGVSGFYAMLDKPGHLITEDAGTHEFTRVFFHNGKFNLGNGYNDRIGSQAVVRAHYDFVLGLTVELTDYVLHVPAGSAKACWKP
jgi:hypothetical protein